LVDHAENYHCDNYLLQHQRNCSLHAALFLANAAEEVVVYYLQKIVDVAGVADNQNWTDLDSIAEIDSC